MPDSATLQRQFDTLYDSIESHFTQTASLTRRPTYARYVSSDSDEEDGDGRSDKGLRLKLALDARRARAETRHRHKEFGLKTQLSPIGDDESGSDDDDLDSAQRRRVFESDDEGDADPFERILFRKPTRGKSMRRAAPRIAPDPATVPALPSIPSGVALGVLAGDIRTSSPEPLAPQAAIVPDEHSMNTPTDGAVVPTEGVSPSLKEHVALAAILPLVTRSVPNKAESLALSDYSILRTPSSKSRPSRPEGNPENWSVSDVIGYLRSRGFSDDVCSHFEGKLHLKLSHRLWLTSVAEQDVSGDILAELNLDNLQNEIGISAFGTRKRIIAAIADLELTQPTHEVNAAQSGETLQTMDIAGAPTGLPSPVSSLEGDKPQVDAVPSLSPSVAVTSLPTPESSPIKSSKELLIDAPSLSRARATTPPSSAAPAIAASSLPTPPETPFPNPPMVPHAPHSPATHPALVPARYEPFVGTHVGRSHPPPSSTSSTSLSPNAAQTQRSPASSSIAQSSPPSPTNLALPPGAARPHIPGAMGHPASLMPGSNISGTNGRPVGAQHRRYASSAEPPMSALPAPIYHLAAGTAHSGAASKTRHSYQPGSNATHIPAALVSGPFKVARATASSAAAGDKNVPDALLPGRARVTAPRGPRWHIRS